jgi:predicted GIY-YIG superfamily endonuclease
MKQQYCYILYNDQNNKTYVGYTVDPMRRLRQHNGEIVGGARYTSRQQVIWKHLCIITCTSQLFDNHKALSLEWHLKHPNCKRKTSTNFYGPRGKLTGVALVLTHAKFVELDIIVYICDQFYEWGIGILPHALRISQAPTLIFANPEVARGQDPLLQEGNDGIISNDEDDS